MHAEIHKTVVIEMSELELDRLTLALSNTLFVIKKEQISLPSVDMEQLQKFYEILDGVD